MRIQYLNKYLNAAITLALIFLITGFLFFCYYSSRYGVCDLAISLPNPPQFYKKGQRGVVFEVNVKNLGPDVLSSKSYIVELRINGVLVDYESSGNSEPLSKGQLEVHGKAKEYLGFSPDTLGNVRYEIIVIPLWNCKDIIMNNNRFEGKFHVIE